MGKAGPQDGLGQEDPQGGGPGLMPGSVRSACGGPEPCLPLVWEPRRPGRVFEVCLRWGAGGSPSLCWDAVRWQRADLLVSDSTFPSDLSNQCSDRFVHFFINSLILELSLVQVSEPGGNLDILFNVLIAQGGN